MRRFAAGSQGDARPNGVSASRQDLAHAPTSTQPTGDAAQAKSEDLESIDERIAQDTSPSTVHARTVQPVDADPNAPTRTAQPRSDGEVTVESGDHATGTGPSTGPSTSGPRLPAPLQYRDRERY